MNIKSILLAMGIMLLLLACGGGGSGGKEHPPPPVSDWASKIAQVEDQINATHPNPNHSISANDLSAEFDALENRANSMNVGDIAVDLAVVLAKLQDAHTSVNLNGYFQTQKIPVEFRWINDVLVVDKADQSNLSLLGKQVVEINGVSLAQVESIAADYISAENNFWRKVLFSQYLRILPLVNRWTQSSENEITLLLEDELAQQETMSISVSQPMNSQTYAVSQGFSLTADPNLANVYHSILTQESTAFLRIQRSVNSMDQSNVDSEVNSVIDAINSQGLTKLIIDLRDFIGGNSQVLRPGISQIASLQQTNNMQIIVLTGNKTISSGLINLYDLVQQANVTTLGDETGGKPAHFGDILQVTIPGSAIQYIVSQQYFVLDGESLETYAPDLLIRESYINYLLGIDSQLEAALAL